MSYRTNFSNTEENSENKMSESKPEDKNVIHDMTFRYHDPKVNFNNCIFCSKFLGIYSQTHFCCPSNRFTEGFLWWEKTCSIAGMHTHYICKTCKYHWIYKRTIPNNPISEI